MADANNSHDPAAEEREELQGVQAARDLIQTGADITGAVAGAAIGLIGGPAGALAGAGIGVAASRVLTKAGLEIQRRVLGPREHSRIGAAAAYAVTATKQLLDAGATPRADGFFDAPPAGRSAADQLLEGVLTKARDSYEEKKLAYLGNLYASLGFHPEVSALYGNFLVTLAGELTYNQLVALAIGAANPQPQLLRMNALRDDDAALAALDNNSVGLITEVFSLYQRGLVHGIDGSVWMSLPDVTFGNYRVQGAGSLLVALMGLAGISQDERQVFYRAFPPASA